MILFQTSVFQHNCNTYCPGLLILPITWKVIILEDFSFQQQKRSMKNVRKFLLDKPYLFRIFADGMIRRGIQAVYMISIHETFHDSSVGGHYGGTHITHTIFQCGYYFLIIYKDVYVFAISCDQCQHQGHILRCHELSMTHILELEIFDVQDVDFMWLFVRSYGKKYILIIVDYISKWVEVVVL